MNAIQQFIHRYRRAYQLLTRYDLSKGWVEKPRPTCPGCGRRLENWRDFIVNQGYR